MLFNSYTFIFAFLPISIFGYWVLSLFKKNTLNIFFLLGLSLLFYGLWKWQLLIILMGSIIFNYIMGFLLIKKRDVRLLYFAIFINIASLFYYKYLNLFKFITGLGDIYEILLPLGISFFTFTQISYLVDCYKGQVEKNGFMDYALFVTYFPHLIAGPVLHHKSMISQFKNPYIVTFNPENLSIGLTIFVIGLFKKVILADSIMQYVEPVFGATTPLHPLDSWGGALAYSLQLYFDFSGYSDMAIGISKMFNIDLPLNFNSPYKAKNLVDFWKRWHISLSSFLKDYLYIPMGGSKNGNFMKYTNIFIVMFLSGIWHGAALTFFVWGLFHGFFLLINHGFNHLKKRYSLQFKMTYPLGTFMSRFLTLGVVVIGWVFFRSTSIDSAVSMTENMLLLNPNAGSFVNSIFPIEGWYLIMLLGFIVFFLPNTQEFMGLSVAYAKNKSGGIMNVYNKIYWRPNLYQAFFLALLLLMCVFNITKKSEFLYFQF